MRSKVKQEVKIQMRQRGQLYVSLSNYPSSQIGVTLAILSIAFLILAIPTLANFFYLMGKYGDLKTTFVSIGWFNQASANYHFIVAMPIKLFLAQQTNSSLYTARD